MRRKFVAGNWKMNGSLAALAELDAIAASAAKTPGVDVAIAVPATLIAPAVDRTPGLIIGAQDVHRAPGGAHTGCISAAMALEAGARCTIIGHSERRANQGESSADVRAKAVMAHAHGLAVILCVGETLAERDSGKAVEVVTRQLADSLPDNADATWLSVAYEPVWAIGTGRVASVSDVTTMHAAIRAMLAEVMGSGAQGVRILYGGSVNADNAGALLGAENVDGALVGGASLKAATFLPIIAAAQAAGA